MLLCCCRVRARGVRVCCSCVLVPRPSESRLRFRAAPGAVVVPDCLTPPVWPVVTTLKSVRDAVVALKERVHVLKSFVRASKDGAAAPDHALLRQISSICSMLPAVDADEFHSQFLAVRYCLHWWFHVHAHV